MRIVKSNKYIVSLIIAVVLLTTLPALLHRMGYIKDHAYINEEVHTFIETFGSIFSLLIAVLIYFRYKNDPEELDYPIIGLSFLMMGLLDGYHAVSIDVNVFVFSHIISVLTGGICFALLILPEKIKKYFRNKNAYLIAVIVWICLVFYMTFLSEFLPQMLKEGDISTFTNVLNLIAFIGFTMGTFRLLSRNDKSNDLEIFFIAMVGLTQGMSRLTFSFSDIWQAEWWLWHVYRFAGSGIILYIVLQTFNSLLIKNARAIKNQQTIIDNMPLGIVIIGMDMRIIQINKTAENLTGHSSEDLPGSYCYNTFLSESCSVCPAVELSSQVINERKELRKKDGSFLPVIKSIIPIEINDVPVLMESFIDISDLKEAEKKLRETLNFLEQSHHELEQLTFIAAHDLQESLRKINFYLDLTIKDISPELTEKTKKNIRILKGNTQKLRQQIAAIHSLTLLNSNTVKPALFELEDIVTDLLDNEFKDLICIHPRLPRMYADQKLIKQLFNELLSNARKFNREEQPKVNIAFGEIGGHWKFEVRDNGIGFEQQYESKIFTAFEKLENKYKYPGNGVGLTKCKKIVVLHGGSIWAKSLPGSGTSVHFTIAKKSHDISTA